MTSEENLICSFCSKGRKDVTKMIVGSSKVSICNECIGLCNEILEEDNIKAKKEKVKSSEDKKLGQITLVTPPDFFQNQNKSFCLINFSKRDKDSFADQLNKHMSDEDITVY